MSVPFLRLGKYFVRSALITKVEYTVCPRQYRVTWQVTQCATNLWDDVVVSEFGRGFDELEKYLEENTWSQKPPTAQDCFQTTRRRKRAIRRLQIGFERTHQQRA